MEEKLKLSLKNGARYCNQLILWIKHKMKTPFEVMRRGERNLFFSFLDFLIFYMNLGPSRTLATSGIVLFVTLVNNFQPWANVSKICVMNVGVILDTSLYSVYNFRNFIISLKFFLFKFHKFLCNFIFINIFCIFVFL